MIMSACGGVDSARAPAVAGDTVPRRGGTLRILGNGDVDHLSTSSSSYAPTYLLFNAFTRQLVAYPTATTSFEIASHLVPDLAIAVPSTDNGGVSVDGRTYTFHLRRGVMWNTSPPREVTAHDALRGIKMMCNPVSPYGSPVYYETTITGLRSYCAAFAKVAGVAADIKHFVDTHEIEGVHAPDDTTLVFTLIAPAADFVNIIAVPFATPVPVEYLDFVPDSPEFRQHTISHGPYQITKYVANRELVLERNPVWNPATDPLRKAWVDRIEVIEGVSAQSVQQQLEAGTADLSFDQPPPTADIARLIGARDPNLMFSPPEDVYGIMWYLAINFLSPNADAALRKVKVREALQYAVDRAAIVQLLGGTKVARPLQQLVHSGGVGFIAGYNAYAGSGERGDPARARQLLAEGGFADGLRLKLLHMTSGTEPMMAQSVQASFARAGITIELLPATPTDWMKYIANPETLKRGVWDLASMQWIPDWFGNNGRAIIGLMLDGRSYGVNSWDLGAYNSEDANRLIDGARIATSESEATERWTKAAVAIAKDAPIVPLIERKHPFYHSARVQNCFYGVATNCDVTLLWLGGASANSR